MTFNQIRAKLALYDPVVLNITIFCVIIRGLFFENIFVFGLILAMPLTYLALRKYLYAQAFLFIWFVIKISTWFYQETTNIFELLLMVFALLYLLTQLIDNFRNISKSAATKKQFIIQTFKKRPNSSLSWFVDIFISLFLILLAIWMYKY